LPRVEGTSRWPQLATGESIADRETFAVGYDATEVALTLGANKLVRTMRTATDGTLEGSVRLFELTADGDVPASDPAIEKELSARLDSWLLSTR
jgi:hypothetical protein